MARATEDATYAADRSGLCAESPRASGKPGSQSGSPHPCQLPKHKSQSRGYYKSVYQTEFQKQEEYNQESTENKDNSPSSTNRICSFLVVLSTFQHIIVISTNIYGLFLGVGYYARLGTVSALWGFSLSLTSLYFSFKGLNLLAKSVPSLFSQSLAQNLPQG